MPKLWAKLKNGSKTINQATVEIHDINNNLQGQVDRALEAICSDFDIEKPMWLQDIDKSFHNFRKATFKSMHFIDEINFTTLELELIIDKKKKKK